VRAGGKGGRWKRWVDEGEIKGWGGGGGVVFVLLCFPVRSLSGSFEKRARFVLFFERKPRILL